jgi:hypothetical protein
VADGKVPSVAVAVARDGEIIWEQGFGLADREKNISATEHTGYALASISKQLTATGLMILVERGLISSYVLTRCLASRLPRPMIVNMVGRSNASGNTPASQTYSPSISV